MSKNQAKETKNDKKGKEDPPTAFGFIANIIKNAKISDKVKNSLSKVMESQTAGISASIENEKTESEYFFNLLKKPWIDQDDNLNNCKSMLTSINSKIEQDILSRKLLLQESIPESNEDLDEKEKLENKKMELLEKMHSLKLGKKQLNIWKDEIVNELKNLGDPDVKKKEFDFLDSKIGLKMLKRRILMGQKILEDREMVNAMKKKLQPTEAERLKKQNIRKQIEIDKFNKNQLEEKLKQEEKEAKDKKKKKQQDEFYLIKMQREDEIKEEKRRLHREFREKLSLQKDEVIQKILKKAPNFDLSLLPSTENAQEIYDFFKKHQAKMRYHKEVDEILSQRKYNDKDYVSHSFQNDEYFKKILERKRKDDEAAQKRLERSEAYQKMVEKSKIENLDYSKPYYELPKDVLRLREAERKKKIIKLAEKIKENHPLVIDEDKKNQRENLIEKLMEREHFHEKIEEIRKEAKEKQPNYIDYLVTLRAGKTIKKPTNLNESASPEILKSQVQKTKHSVSLPKILPKGRNSYDHWEAMIKNEKMDKVQKYEKLIYESQRLDEMAKRKEVLSKVLSMEPLQKGSGKSNVPLQMAPSKNFDDTISVYYANSIKTKLALLNEL